MLIGQCALPSIGRNVTIKGYSYGVEGTQILYFCEPGFVPRDEVLSNCTNDGKWSPDPSLHVCTGKKQYCNSST